MKIRISISKKIMGMVIFPIICICLITGLVTSNMTKNIITDETDYQSIKEKGFYCVKLSDWQTER